MWTLVITGAHVLGIISAIDAVMSTRTSQGAIAWSISLVTFPYVAVPAYWVLGRSKFQGYISARRSEDQAVRDDVERAAVLVEPYRIPDSEKRRVQEGRAAEGLAGIPYLKGNAVELLIDGDATFGSILDGIDRAQEYVLFQFFIVKDDGIGNTLKNHLVARAQAGVRVYFLYDEIGSHDLPKSYLDELRAAGVQATAFNTRKGRRNRFQLNFRNHRKIVVVDGRMAWVGGHNVGDEYLGRDPKFGHWRDTHMKVTGPAALGLQVSFFEDWHWASNEALELNWHPVPAPDGDVQFLTIPTGPADELESAMLMFIHAINSARERIWIASPYFVPDGAVVAALQLAGLRGVDVRILIPDTPDHLMVFLAAFSYFDESSITGVRFFRYQYGFLHAKTMLIDDFVSAIGTANFDNRSFRLNFEVTGVVIDTAFATEMERMFLDDFARAREMRRGEYHEKPWYFKLGVKLARLTAPIQ